MADSTKELANQLAAKRDELAAIFDKYKDDAGGLKAMPTEVLEDVRARNTELADLDAKWQAQREITDIAAKNAERRGDLNAPQGQIFPAQSADGPKPETKSLGATFTDSQEFKQGVARSMNRFGISLPYDIKTAMTLTAGYAQAQERTGRNVMYATRRPVVADFMPNTTTTANNIRYMEETTFTNATAATAENAVKQESADAWTERSVPVEVYAHWLPVTNQQLEDIPGIQSLINNRLLLMLELAEETALLSGTGTPPEITGIYNKASIGSQPKGADPTPSAIYKAFTKVRHTGFAEPSVVFLHPNDWQDIRLLQDGTGNYVWGAPSVVGPETMFGKPVVVTTAATEGTGITGDFAMYSELFRIGGIRLDVTDSHSDYFIYNKQVIRVEERIAAVWYRAGAFCEITGI